MRHLRLYYLWLIPLALMLGVARLVRLAGCVLSCGQTEADSPTEREEMGVRYE